MKQIIKYAAVVFALVLAASIIGGCLTAGVAVVRMIVEKTDVENDTQDGRVESLGRNNGLWYEDEDGDLVFMGIRFGNSGDVKSGSEEFAASEIQSLDIEGLSGELIIEAWDKDSVSVVYENIAEEYEIYADGDVLKIQCDQGWFSFNVSFKELPKIHVQVPADKLFEDVIVDKGSGSMKMNGILAQVIHVDSGSGATTISDVEARELYMDSGSGSVNISDISVRECKVNSGSGAVTLKEIAAEKTILDSGSGTVTVKDSEIGEASVDTGSGFVNFEEVTAENLVVDSGSGRVNFVGALTGNSVFDTSSGSVNLEIYGEEEDYNIQADLGSGGLYINGDKEKDTEIEHPGADNLLVFDTGSGRVSIEFLGAREVENDGSGRAGK